MTRKVLIIMVVLALCTCMVALAACGTDTGIFNGTQTTTNTETTNTDNSVSTAEAVTDTSIEAQEVTSDFAIAASEGGAVSQEGSVYTVTAAGTYTLTGALNGQIVVDAADAEVVLELCGVTLTCGTDSPIKVVAASKVEIAAKKGTDNVIKDTRSAKTTDTDTLGEGAIYAKCDLKLKGEGTLVITADYNNGVHTTKDLTIQKLSLKVTAVNNALKGNDSVTIKSGVVVAISTKGDGIKTENTDADKKGETRGDVTISGGSVAVYAAGDGVQAAHNFTLTADGDEAPSLTIYTGSYSGYTASSASTTSYKGVKAQNELTIAAGTVAINSYDDALHCDYGTAFDAGGSGQGTITISGGSLTLSVYAPTTKTMGGMFGPGSRPGGWGGQQTVSGADAIRRRVRERVREQIDSLDSNEEMLRPYMR